MLEHDRYYDWPERDAEDAERDRDYDEYLWDQADAAYDAMGEADYDD
jgi:hypothetical protein